MSPKFALLVVFMGLIAIAMGAHLKREKMYHHHSGVKQISKQEQIQVNQNPMTSVQTIIKSAGPASSIVQVPISESVQIKTKSG